MKTKSKNNMKTVPPEIILMKPKFSLSYYSESKTVALIFRTAIPLQYASHVMEMTIQNVLEKGAHCLLLDMTTFPNLIQDLKASIEQFQPQLLQAGIEKIACVCEKELLAEMQLFTKNVFQINQFDTIDKAKQWLL